jgi:hypothetical protein
MPFVSVSFFLSSHRTGGIETAGPIRPDDAHHSDGSIFCATPHPHSHDRQGVDPTKEADVTNGNSAVSKEATGQSKLAGNTIHIVPNDFETKRILLKKPAPPPVTPLRFVWQLFAVCACITVWRARDVGVIDKTKRRNPPA